MPKIIFLVPSYQPTILSCELLEELWKTDPAPIVVVDDGSGPTYRELFQRASRVPGATVLTNAINLGKGAALKHGMNHILVNHPDCAGVVTADADGQHAVGDILKVANELRARPATGLDLLKSRYARDDRVSAARGDTHPPVHMVKLTMEREITP